MNPASGSRDDHPASGLEAPAMPGGSWRVVPEQSRIGFRVRKMGLYFVKGTFKGVVLSRDMLDA